YSFAVPSNITRKIVEDIMEFGNVQRVILGVEGGELNPAASKELGINLTDGFYIGKVTKDSGAEKSGLTKGDVITKLDNHPISTYSDLQNVLNAKRPNDKIQVTFIRNEKTLTVPVTLTKNEFVSTEFKGIELEDIDAADKKRFRLDYGVKIKDITNDNLAPYADQLKGNIILKIDDVKATNVETVSKLLEQKSEDQSIQIEMISKEGQILRVII
ncbi:MAG TPA: PDZ domain-containing protein, partial [Flavobacterium sp.]|nr:PDZ domain-containing protein [Flavobacterium sp.]